jgi:hypothetical protein
MGTVLVFLRLGEPDFYSFDWLKTATADFYSFDWLKTATDFESLVPRRKGMNFYRASNSPSWGAAVWKALYAEDGDQVAHISLGK